MYEFQSEGMTSVREVVFKKNNDGFVQGFGAMRMDGQKEVFVDASRAAFDSGIEFKASPCQTDASSDASSQKVSFEGTISAYDTGCFVDATCSVTVGGKTVILVTGGRAMSGDVSGTLRGVDSIGDLESHIGKKARVYAKQLSANQ